MNLGDLEREEYEDDLYRDSDGDSGLSAESDVETYLYSQLHYLSNPVETLQDPVSKLKSQTSLEKGQWPPKACEVIVIDSGSDVILISDDDKGVCSSKGARSRCQRTLTNQTTSSPGAQPKSRPSHPLEVVVLGSDEEGSDQGSDEMSDDGEKNREHDADPDSDPDSASESESDSDRLEKWMILGQNKRKEDRSIQLNLEGADVSDNEDQGSWRISKKDEMAQIFNIRPGERRAPFRTATRYYTDKNVVCNNCRCSGHLSKSCPNPKKQMACLHCGQRGHGYRDCLHTYCRNCGLPGHYQDECSEPSYWFRQCHRCNMKGHIQDACPQIWRQFHVTTKAGALCKPSEPQAHRSPPYCYNCSKMGHFGFECSLKQMFSGTHPSLPYTSYYDQHGDFKRRENFAKRKANELAESGHIVPEVAPAHPQQQVLFQPHKRRKTSYPGNPYSHKLQVRKQVQPNSLTPQHGPSRFKRVAHSRQSPKTPTADMKSQHNSPGRQRKCHSLLDKDVAQTPQGQKSKKKRKRSSSQLLVNDDADFPRTPGQFNPRNPSMIFSVTSDRTANQRKVTRKKMKRLAAKKAQRTQTCPSDENLFLIKQRKKRS